ncbi:MAG: SDR family oxidoreductase [Firmicutes bacterium]|nr:SDR family oxidoreductase [Bacillota bacterium]
MSGHVALVTGAGHGLGQAIGEALASRGCRVYGSDLREDELFETGQRIRSSGGFFQGSAMDVRDAGAWAEWVNQVVQSEAGIHILVNDAGGVAGQTRQPVEDVPDEDFDIIVKINLYGAFYGIRAVAPMMKAQRYGRIINISSGAGRSHSLTGIQAYTSAKAGQIGLTRQMAAELGPYGITVNNVAPGFVISNPATRRQWEAMGPEGQQTLVESIPLRRLGKPEDIAAMVCFFASPEAGYVTGQVISVDGGMAMF